MNFSETKNTNWCYFMIRKNIRKGLLSYRCPWELPQCSTRCTRSINGQDKSLSSSGQLFTLRNGMSPINLLNFIRRMDDRPSASGSNCIDTIGNKYNTKLLLCLSYTSCLCDKWHFID